MEKIIPQIIPPKIHYFWFGKGEKSELEKKCIERFSTFAPLAEIKEWNESNFDVLSHPYTAQAYKDKKWAFVSDYARLKVLYEEGGIYLDTDMFLVKDLTPLFNEGTFLGKEDDTFINAAVVGAVKGDNFILDILHAYDELTERITIPQIVTKVYKNGDYKVKIYEKDFFYPFSQQTIREFTGTNAPSQSYMVHMWNYSWGNPVLRKFKKFTLYKKMINFLEILQVKKLIKRIINLE